MARIFRWPSNAFMFLIAAFFSSLSVASAATIEKVIDVPGYAAMISLEGEIMLGDHERFLQAIEGVDHAIVILASSGGALGTAIEIGATLHASGLSTLVAGGKHCYSACALIWVAGNNRYMGSDSLIGFHAAFVEENGEAREIGIGNAVLGSYLTQLGLSIDFIRFATIAGLDEINLLTPDRARALGIDVTIIKGDQIVPPSERPTGPALAKQFEEITFWETVCEPVLWPLPPALNRAREVAAEEGRGIMGVDKYSEWRWRSESGIIERIDSIGVVLSCLASEEWLLSQGLETGSQGPGFDCRSASTASQQAICANKSLWADDLVMNRIYLVIRDAEPSEGRTNYLTDQRAWMVEREACAGDVDCIRALYDRRLTELVRILHL